MYKEVNSEEILQQFVKDRKLYLPREAECGSNTDALKQKTAWIGGGRGGCKKSHLYFNSNY